MFTYLDTLLHVTECLCSSIMFMHWKVVLVVSVYVLIIACYWLFSLVVSIKNDPCLHTDFLHIVLWVPFFPARGPSLFYIYYSRDQHCWQQASNEDERACKKLTLLFAHLMPGHRFTCEYHIHWWPLERMQLFKLKTYSKCFTAQITRHGQIIVMEDFHIHVSPGLYHQWSV